MRKLFVALAFLGICGVSNAQISDNAVIPISVTINSVLRLQVVSGGNIQFVFNTMEQFTAGITTTDRTTTTFNVSSSRPYDVAMGTEDPKLMGISTGGLVDLGLIQYQINVDGSTSTPKATTTSTGMADLANAAVTIVSNAGAETNGEFLIEWEAGTGTTKATGIAPDTYVTNVFLTLIPKTL